MRRLAAGLVIVALGRLLSPDALPVYDGVGAPDEPYKYVGSSNAPKASSSARAVVKAGVSAGVQVRSTETGPQVVVDLGQGAFRATTPTVTLTAAPLAGDGQHVPQGTIDGNVYRISASPGATLLPERAQGFLFLRAAVMTEPNPVIVHRAGSTGSWAQVKTVRAGVDILSTPMRALGDYAVVHLPGSKPLSQGDGLGRTRLILLFGGIAALLVITVLILRRPAAGQRRNQPT